MTLFYLVVFVEGPRHAFLKSQKITSIVQWSSRAAVHSSKDSDKFVRHGLALENPCCLSVNSSLSVRNEQM